MAIAHELQNITEYAHTLYHFMDYGVMVGVLYFSYLVLKKI